MLSVNLLEISRREEDSVLKSSDEEELPMKKNFKKAISVMLATALTVSMLPIQGTNNEVLAESVTLQNPRIVADSNMEAGQKVTWDCIWFGSYPQAEVIPSSEYTALDSSLLQDGDAIVSDTLYAKLQSATGWDANGDITMDGSKYRRIKQSDATYATSGDEEYYSWSDYTTYHYFKYEPIKWRVLNVNENDALLLADKGLDDQKYHEEYADITWETSTIRSWLNGYGASSNAYGTDYSSSNFMDTAFSSAEQSSVKTTTVINDDNIEYGTEGGNNTNDKVFLLSESEVYTDSALSYGFVSDYRTYDEARRSKSSTYAKAMGTWSDTGTDWRGNCDWWLRSPGRPTYDASHVISYGYVNGVGRNGESVRPALHLNLSSPNLYSYAGTVCSDGEVHEEEMTSQEETSTEQITQEQTTTSNQPTVLNTENTSEVKQNISNSKPSVEKLTNKSNVSIAKLVAKKKALKVTWKKKAGVNGYQLQYSTSKKFKKAKTITIKKAKTTTKNIKKLKAKKKYYVRIRTYITVNGKKYYSKWSKVKSKKTK